MRCLAVVSILLLAGGCQTFDGFPDPPKNIVYLHEDDTVASNLDAAETHALKLYHAADPAQRQAMSPQEYRNSFIYSELGAINDSFDDFLHRLRADRSKFNILTSGTLLTLNGLSATTGGAATKAALGAASAGIIGQKGTIDQELFNAETLAALIARMKAARLAALVPIKAGLTQPTGDYPLEAALVDLHAYREAGNLLATIDNISFDAGQTAGKAQADIARVTRGADYKSSIPTRKALQDRVAKLNDQRAVALAWLMQTHLAERATDFQSELAGMNASGSRFRDGTSARNFLDYWLEEDSGAPDEIAEWTAALTLVEQN